MSVRPKWKHDHDGCSFLGRYETDGLIFDLYFCDQGGGLPTVIARDGNDPDSYLSGWSSNDFHPALNHAKALVRLAIHQAVPSWTKG